MSTDHIPDVKKMVPLLGLGLGEGLGAGAGARCMCKDRAAKDCPGEWEPGCDLGNNPAHVRVGRKGVICPKCGTDRTRAACPKGHHAALTGDCPMVGVAQGA